MTARDRIVAAAIASPRATAAEIAEQLGTKLGTTKTVLSQWRNGHYSDLPPPLEPGASYEPEFIEVDVRCICDARQTDTVPGDELAREVLARLVCRSCERVGTLSLVPSISHPPSRDPDP